MLNLSNPLPRQDADLNAVVMQSIQRHFSGQTSLSLLRPIPQIKRSYLLSFSMILANEVSKCANINDKY